MTGRVIQSNSRWRATERRSIDRRGRPVAHVLMRAAPSRRHVSGDRDDRCEACTPLEIARANNIPPFTTRATRATSGRHHPAKGCIVSRWAALEHVAGRLEVARFRSDNLEEDLARRAYLPPRRGEYIDIITRDDTLESDYARRIHGIVTRLACSSACCYRVFNFHLYAKILVNYFSQSSRKTLIIQW